MTVHEVGGFQARAGMARMAIGTTGYRPLCDCGGLTGATRIVQQVGPSTLARAR